MWNPLMKFTAGKMTPPQMRFTAWELGTGYATCLQKKTNSIQRSPGCDIQREHQNYCFGSIGNPPMRFTAGL